MSIYTAKRSLFDWAPRKSETTKEPSMTSKLFITLWIPIDGPADVCTDQARGAKTSLEISRARQDELHTRIMCLVGLVHSNCGEIILFKQSCLLALAKAVIS